MSTVVLVSGGLDSTLMAVLAREMGITIFPLYVDYGQLARSRELSACREVFRKLELPQPEVIDMSGIGAVIPSGLTKRTLHVYDEAFLPGRNLFFLLAGAAYGYKHNADAVAIGLLDESLSKFPDQTKAFTIEAEHLLSMCLGIEIRVLTPLIGFTKADVVALAKDKGISGTYSCHAGRKKPCGKCIACKEFIV